MGRRFKHAILSILAEEHAFQAAETAACLLGASDTSQTRNDKIRLRELQRDHKDNVDRTVRNARVLSVSFSFRQPHTNPDKQFKSGAAKRHRAYG